VRDRALNSTRSRDLSGFGAPGHLRVSFGSLPPDVCEQAAQRLRQGLQDIVDGKLLRSSC
jgi:hypothetical protein